MPDVSGAKETRNAKVAIVVGGGSGIGAACVREFAANGYTVVGMSPSGRARELAESLGGAGVDGANTDPDALRAVVDLAVSRFGRIDALVNSSGHAARARSSRSPTTSGWPAWSCTC